MLALLVVTALVAGGSAPSPAPPTAIGAVPDEPDAFVLPDERATYQAVAADIDGDGIRELVRLIAGPESSLLVEAWHEVAGGWAQAAEPAEVEPSILPGAGGIGGDPVRLVVRSVAGRDRVTVVRQPLRDEPGLDEPCCLRLDDLVLEGGSLDVRRLAASLAAADTIHAVDFDGDGTDELLITRAIPPQGVETFPSEARVLRWAGETFAPPTATELPVGSGDMPFVIGDSDGRPGDEAAIISTLGTPELYRLTVDTADRVRLEAAGIVPSDAVAVPLSEGRGIAVLGSTSGLSIRPWPAGEPLGEPLAERLSTRSRFLGVVTVQGRPALLVQQESPDALHVLTLPGLTPPPGNPVTRSPSAAALAPTPVHPYVGPVPGGGLDGEPAVIYGGRLLPSDDLAGAPFATFGAALMASLAGAEPIGLVGRDRGWLAILHNPLSLERLDPSGGFIGTRIAQPAEAVSLAPIAIARTPEVDGGSVEPVVVTADRLPSGELGVGPGGFVATVEAPIGSRIYVKDPNGRAVGATVEIDGNGRESAILQVPDGAGSGDRFRASLTVVTPAGHGYVARWDALLLSGPPRLEVDISTRFAARTEVRGQTAPYATVTVAGEPVTVGADGTFATSLDLPPWPTDVGVVATDPVGNARRAAVSAVGFYDYRGLPWLAIVGGLVAAAAVVLLLRVPHANPFRRGEEDDAVLEELESD